MNWLGGVAVWLCVFVLELGGLLADAGRAVHGRFLAAEKRIYTHRMKWLGLGAVILLGVMVWVGKVETVAGFILMDVFYKWIDGRRGGPGDDTSAELTGISTAPLKLAEPK